MAIENRVRELIDRQFADKGEPVNLTRVQEATGLNFATVSRWYKDQVTNVNFATLETWCKYFNCDVGDVLKIKPTKKGKG